MSFTLARNGRIETVVRITGYKGQGVAASAALVNAVTTSGAHSDDDALQALIREHGFFSDRFTPADGVALRAFARALRPFFECTELAAAVEMLNALMLQVPMQPHLSDHDDLGLHMHAAPPSSAFIHRFRATVLMSLAELLCDHGLSRTGACAADGCDRVYADTSRGGRRRFCSESCANRTNVAAFRARRRARA
jgi:hypothetical protein